MSVAVSVQPPTMRYVSMAETITVGSSSTINRPPWPTVNSLIPETSIVSYEAGITSYRSFGHSPGSGHDWTVALRANTLGTGAFTMSPLSLYNDAGNLILEDIRQAYPIGSISSFWQSGTHIYFFTYSPPYINAYRDNVYRGNLVPGVTVTLGGYIYRSTINYIYDISPLRWYNLFYDWAGAMDYAIYDYVLSSSQRAALYSTMLVL